MPTKQLGKFKLYFKGDWDKSIFSKCMAVVGSRRMTTYGRRVIEKIVPKLVFDGWTIVSGLMYGVDQASHEICLECGGKTIAVLGWGINYKAGEKEQELEDKIVETGGLVISLWKDQIGTNWTFPVRNKVIVEICHELIVVEAAEKSGALLTTAMANKVGKKVWAVPGPITSSVSAGTNKLIAEGKALAWIGGIHQSAFPTKQDAALRGNSAAKNDLQNAILALTQNEGLEAGEIARRLGVPMEKVASELTLLTLGGILTEREGKYFVG